jgi:hypothetical protein
MIIEQHIVAGPECSTSMTNLKTLLSCHHTKSTVTCSLNPGVLHTAPPTTIDIYHNLVVVAKVES